jgi:hypothetical protein
MGLATATILLNESVGLFLFTFFSFNIKNPSHFSLEAPLMRMHIHGITVSNFRSLEFEYSYFSRETVELVNKKEKKISKLT